MDSRGVQRQLKTEPNQVVYGATKAMVPASSMASKGRATKILTDTIAPEITEAACTEYQKPA
jgi:hypothetical protein